MSSHARGRTLGVLLLVFSTHIVTSGRAYILRWELKDGGGSGTVPPPLTIGKCIRIIRGAQDGGMLRFLLPCIVKYIREGV